MAGERRGLRGYALHQIAIADDPIGEMIDDLGAGPVVTRRQVRFGHRETDAVAEALTQRPGGRLHAWRNAPLGMARRHAAPLAKPLDLFERKIVAGEVKQTVQQHRTVPGREHETIAVEPTGIGWVVFEEPGPQHIRHRRRAHRHSRVAAIGLLHGVHGEEAQSVDALIVQCRIERHCRRRCVHSNSPFDFRAGGHLFRVRLSWRALALAGNAPHWLPALTALFAPFDADAVDMHHLTAEPAGYKEECDADDRKHDGSAQARA